MSYPREKMYEGFVPLTANDNFKNEAVAGNKTPVAFLGHNVVPSNPSQDDLPWLEPVRETEEERAAGDGLNVGEIYNKGFGVGAGSKRAKCLFGHHIPCTLGKATAAMITGDVAEIFTIKTIKDTDKSLLNTYFLFEVIDSDAPKPIIRYYCWMNVNTEGTDPTIAGRTAVEIAIATNATAATIASSIKDAIDALTDCGASVASTTVTVTLATKGAVDNVYDSVAAETGFTFATTTDGVMTIVLTESSTLPNIGYHYEKEETTAPIRVDVVGVTQNEYLMEIESGGILEEEKTFMISQSITGSDLARPQSPNGNQWTTAQNPLADYKVNFAWGDMTFTFKYNETAFPCTILSWKIQLKLTVDYKKSDGDVYANARYVRLRDLVVTMTVRPKDSADPSLRTVSKLHYKDYAGHVTLVVKIQRGSDTNDFIQWALTRLRLLQFDHSIVAPDPGWDEHQIELHAAPGNGITCTQKGYLSQKYFGVA